MLGTWTLWVKFDSKTYGQRARGASKQISKGASGLCTESMSALIIAVLKGAGQIVTQSGRTTT